MSGNHDVIPMQSGMWFAKCECGAESVQRAQASAWRWLLEHRCLIDVQQDLQQN